jgi:hypothetical protein
MGQTTKDLIAGDGGTDEAFDVRNDQVISGEVVHEGPATGVVHAIGQIPHQHDIEAGTNLPPESEGASQHAHVRVDSDKDHIFDLLVFQDVPDFIRDR